MNRTFAAALLALSSAACLQSPTTEEVAAGALGSQCDFVPVHAHPVAARADGDVFWDGLYSDQTALYMSPTEPRPTDPVTLRVRVQKGDITSANLKYFDSAERRHHVLPMRWVRNDPTGRFDYWQATVPASPSTKWYRFQLVDGARAVWLNACGPAFDEVDQNDFWIAPGYRTPDWSKDAIWYQIFPDRFANGDRSNDPAGVERSWDAAPTTGNFFGGDLEGMRQHLPYLQELGVDALYLNPVFRSPSNHKYDAEDYRAVDPAFGGDDALVALIADAHARGMRVVLDGAFNHVAPTHPWFDRDGRAPELGAFEGGAPQRSSPTYDWFTFDGSRCGYATFFGFCSMAKLDFAAPALQEEMWGGDDSIVQHWLRAPYEADGWRFDTAHMLGMHGRDGDGGGWILGQFRRAIKAVDPDRLVIGETDWGGDQTQWIAGDQLDGVMNYEGFGMPITAYVNGRDIGNGATSLDGRGLDRWLRGTLARGPHQAMLTAWNSLGTHDIPRFLERGDGDVWKMFEAAIFQMTYVGAPVIYYGDEIGMRGGADPDNRRTFTWDRSRWNQELLGLHERLAQVRREQPALRRGGFQTLAVDATAGVYAYGRADRDDDGQVVVVLTNRGTTAGRVTVPVWTMSVPDGAVLVDALRGGRYLVRDGAVDIDGLWGHYGVVLTRQ